LSSTLQTVLTLVEIVVLVAGLAVFLLIFAGQLRSIADTMGQLSERLRTTEQRLRDLGPAAEELNAALADTRTALAPLAQRAESSARAMDAGPSEGSVR
jgi:hypothetical protein